MQLESVGGCSRSLWSVYISARGFNFYHIKDAANCLIIQFGKILPGLHKSEVCVCVCVCLNLARAIIMAALHRLLSSTGMVCGEVRGVTPRLYPPLSWGDVSHDAFPEQLSSAATSAGRNTTSGLVSLSLSAPSYSTAQTFTLLFKTHL